MAMKEDKKRKRKKKQLGASQEEMIASRDIKPNKIRKEIS